MQMLKYFSLRNFLVVLKSISLFLRTIERYTRSRKNTLISRVLQLVHAVFKLSNNFHMQTPFLLQYLSIK